MAKDLAIEMFAFTLYRCYWEENDMSYVLSHVPVYPDAIEYPKEVLKAIYTIHLLSGSFYSVLDDEYDEFSTSRSDFHSYFMSHCRLFDVKLSTVMVKVLSSAALIIAMGLRCRNKENFIFVHNCPLSWAMYFDWELKDEFYEHGGWIALQNYSSGFQNTYAFVVSFQCKWDIHVQLLEYFKFYAPKMLRIFDEKVAEQWRRLTNAMMTILSDVINCKPRFDSNLQDLVLLSMFLNDVCNLTQFNFLSSVRENQLFHCPNDMICLKLDKLEGKLQEIHNWSCNPIQDSKSDEVDRNKNRYEEAVHSYYGLRKQTESPDDFNMEPKIPFKSESQKHPIASSPNSRECTKTNLEQSNNEGNGKQIRSSSSNQSVHTNITEAKALNKGRKKHKGKKKKPLKKSVIIKLKNPNEGTDENAPAGSVVPNSQDDLDIVLQNVLVLGIPSNCLATYVY